MAMTFAASGCSPRACDVAFRWSAVLAPATTYEDVRGLHVQLCRGAECDAGDLSLPAEPPSFGGGYGDSPFDGAAEYATVFVNRRRDGSFELELWWPSSDPRDGDRYRIDVTDRGARVAGLEETVVDYEESDRDGLVGDECRSTHLGALADAGR